MRKEVDKQNQKILDFIKAFEEVFKNARELDKKGFPTVDDDSVEDYQSVLRNMVIDNIEYDMMCRIKEIRKKYK